MGTIYRSRATLAVGGAQCLITTYWSTSNAVPDAPTATEAMARVRAMFNSAAALITSSAVLTFDPVVQIIDETTGTLVNAATGATPAAVAFTGSLTVLPPQTQGLARFSTPQFVRGRNLKGRMFLPGVIQSSSTSAGAPTAGYISSWNTALGLLGTTIVTPISQVVWSRPTGPGASDGMSGAVSGRSVASTFAVQRGRRS